MAEELTLEEAKKLVAQFSDPKHLNKEHELFKSAAAKLLEETDPAFEYEYEAEEEVEEKSVKIKDSGNFFKQVKDYGAEVVNNVQSLGAAGSVAFSSATYFQGVEAIETTQEVAAVVESVEADYNQTLAFYFMEEMSNRIMAMADIPVIGAPLEAISNTMSDVADNMETYEEREERKAAEAEESVEEVTDEVTEESSEEQTQSEEPSEEQTQSEEVTEEVTEEPSEEQTANEESAEEAESDNKQEQPKDNNENERGEESKNEESNGEADRSEATSDVQTDSIQSETNDSGYIDNDLDPIKPHSMVDDIFNDPPVMTPIDAIVASPAGPARTVSPVK
jgi:outer membrane biosynthesis protein TonB